MDCALTNNNFANCTCGINLEGNAYCDAAPGDVIYSKIHLLMQTMVQKNTNCSTFLRFSARCPEIQEHGQILHDLILYAVNLPKYTNPPNCAAETLHSAFRNFSWMMEHYEIRLPTLPGQTSEQTREELERIKKIFHTDQIVPMPDMERSSRSVQSGYDRVLMIAVVMGVVFAFLLVLYLLLVLLWKGFKSDEVENPTQNREGGQTSLEMQGTSVKLDDSLEDEDTEQHNHTVSRHSEDEDEGENDMKVHKRKKKRQSKDEDDEDEEADGGHGKSSGGKGKKKKQKGKKESKGIVITGHQLDPDDKNPFDDDYN
jgi:hypothetical protein